MVESELTKEVFLRYFQLTPSGRSESEGVEEQQRGINETMEHLRQLGEEEGHASLVEEMLEEEF